MIASLYQSGSVALAIFFTQRVSNLFDAAYQLPFTGGFGSLSKVGQRLSDLPEITRKSVELDH